MSDARILALVGIVMLVIMVSGSVMLFLGQTIAGWF